MNYLETLISLEPSPITNNPKNYGIAYFVRELEEWHCIKNLDLWQVWYACKVCAELGREIRVRHNATLQIVSLHARAEEKVLLLNLFSNRISGRCGKDADK